MRPGLDEVDHSKKEDRPTPEVENISDLDRRWDVADAEVVALAAVNPDGDADHEDDEEIVTPENV